MYYSSASGELNQPMPVVLVLTIVTGSMGYAH